MAGANGPFWIGGLLIGVVLLAPNLRAGRDDGAAPTPPESPGTPPLSAPPPSTLAREVVRAADGHFYADAHVNGAPVRFLVDTGATTVALTRADAQRADIPLGPERAVAIGAGGEVEVVPVSIERLALGPLEARDVRAAVVDELPVSLLGQTFLAQLGTVEIRRDRMIFR